MDQDRLETIVPARASRGSQPQFAEAKGSVVQNDKNLRVVDPVVTGIIADGFAAQIHESLWLHQQASTAQRNLGIPLRLKVKFHCEPAGKFVDDQKTRIVARAEILTARVPEADDKTKDGCMLHARRAGSYFLGSAVASDSSAFFSLITSGAAASSSRDGSSATVGSETRKTVRSPSGTAMTPVGSLMSRTCRVFAHVETGNVDHNDLGQILRQAPDRKQAHTLLEQTAKGLDADRLSLGLKNDFRVDLFVHGNRVEINVNDLAAHGMVLDLLNEREPAGGLFSIIDLELDKDVLADGAREQVLDVPLLDFEIRGGILGAVDDSGNRAAGAHFADRIAPGFAAGTGGEFDLIGHGLFPWIPNIKERAYRLIIVNAPDALAEQFGHREHLDA